MINEVSYSTIQSEEPPRHKMGDVRASDGKLFWAYEKQYRADGSYSLREQWYSPESFQQKREKQRQAARKHIKSEAYRARAAKRKDATKKWAKSERGRALCRARKRTPKAIKKRREYGARPEVRERAKQKAKERYGKPEVVAAYRQKYAEIKADPERCRRMMDSQREWRQNNKERFKELQKRWHERNPGRANQYIKNRYATDPSFAMAYRVRARVYQAIQKGGASKTGSTEELVGCSFDYLRDHIERQFKGRMSWDNPSSFHIDHVVPLASFDLTDPAQLKVACNWQNLRPLPPKKNMSKGAKLTEPQMPLPISFSTNT
jgi:hypothetical protein